MKCVLCKQGETKSGKATVSLQRGESTVIIKDVPADIRGAVGEQLEEGQSRANTANTLDMNTHEKDLIVRALTETDGNRTEAAKRLGISRRMLP